MTNGEKLIDTVESVMGVKFDDSFKWKELDHDVVIAFDGNWWTKEREEWQDEFNKMCESATPKTFVADEWYRNTFGENDGE